MKTLFLDIDYTLVDGDTPRPHLKEFLEYVNDKYNVIFDNPHSDKVIQAEGWMKDRVEDDYLIRIKQIL